MTLRTYGQMLLRRWYVLLVLLACTALVVAALPRSSGVYWTRATVVFLPPLNPDQVGNVLEGSDESLIYFAAAVQQRVTNGSPGPQLSSTSATLYGAGVRRGTSVTLLNSGGQWQTNYNRPMLNVEVVDGSEAATQAQVDRLVAEISGTAVALQRDAGATERTMIRTELSPQVPVISYVPNSWTRAVLGVGLLGGGLSLAGTLVVDRLLARRRRSAAPQHARGGQVAAA